LQSQKDMLATTDILLEEQMEKTKERDATLSQQKNELTALRQQAKELESLKTKVKNMERAELENRSLRKTIVTLAGQMDKIERSGVTTDQPVSSPIVQAPLQATDLTQQAATVNAYVPQQDGDRMMNWNLNNPTHMVWDPAVRSLVPITGTMKYNNNRKSHHNNNNQGGHHQPQHHQHQQQQQGGHHQLGAAGVQQGNPSPRIHQQQQQQQHHQRHKKHGNKKKQWQPNDAAYSNGRLINRFPRRYTSSHLPRYRRKYEMTEYNRFEQNKL